jgi:hypothetical protein
MGGNGSGVRNDARRAEVKRLLGQNKPVLNFTQIGEMVGVSRERVRQLAKEIGVVGRLSEGGLRGQARVNGR